ncbi:MAG: inositol monophosphatase family protein [Dehalococcoidia bacterium]
MPLPDPEELLAAAQNAAHQAGSILRAAFGGVQEAVTKSHARDLVTRVDLASERLILNLLGPRWPAIGLLAEETGLTRPATDALWIIDPLDGTANFARGYPAFSVSIACVDRDGPVAGVVYDPLRDDLFAAARGAGTRLNDQAVRVSAVEELSGALFTTGYPYFPPEQRRLAGEVFTEVMVIAAAARRSGSAALDIAYVASGRSEMHYELKLAPHDVAAGILLVREAGGRVDMLRSPGATGWPIGTVATNGQGLHDEVLAIVSPRFGLEPAPFSFGSLFD